MFDFLKKLFKSEEEEEKQQECWYNNLYEESFGHTDGPSENVWGGSGGAAEAGVVNRIADS